MTKTLTYQEANYHDNINIAYLHKSGIPTGFLSKQSLSFLEALYLYLIENEIVYVAKDKDKVVGFIAVSINTAGLYKRFLKSNHMLLIKFALKNIFSIEFLKKAYETLNAPKKVRIKEMEIELPELLSIVVDDTYAGKGVGKQLLASVEEELHLINQDKYKVLVGARLKANQFYVKNGFVVLKEVELHKGISSYIYTKKIIGKIDENISK